jgi:hypothetical protein
MSLSLGIQKDFMDTKLLNIKANRTRQEMDILAKDGLTKLLINIPTLQKITL